MSKFVYSDRNKVVVNEYLPEKLTIIQRDYTLPTHTLPTHTLHTHTTTSIYLTKNTTDRYIKDNLIIYTLDTTLSASNFIYLKNLTLLDNIIRHIFISHTLTCHANVIMVITHILSSLYDNDFEILESQIFYILNKNIAFKNKEELKEAFHNLYLYILPVLSNADNLQKSTNILLPDDDKYSIKMFSNMDDIYHSVRAKLFATGIIQELMYYLTKKDMISKNFSTGRIYHAFKYYDVDNIFE